MKATLFVLLLATCVLAELVPTISLERENVHLGFEKVKLNWKIENTDSSPVLLLKFGTPLEGTFQNTLTSKMFSIVNENGVSPIYTGILMKRDLSPHPDNYQIINGNSEVSGQIILTDAYHFNEDGVYTIQLVTSRSNMINSYPLTSNVVQLKISGTIPLIVDAPVNQAVTFKSCSDSQTGIVQTAISRATSASANALAYLNKGCTPTYVTWFGTYSSSNYGTVDSHFTAINNAFNANNFAIDCGTCKQPGTYAYVYPNDPSKTIYLCPVFWDSSTGAYTYNSQPGTLTHEMSHFDAVAGTEDYQYGVTGCKNLASTNPTRAIANADNHEYFQESGPSC